MLVLIIHLLDALQPSLLYTCLVVGMFISHTYSVAMDIALSFLVVECAQLDLHPTLSSRESRLLGLTFGNYIPCVLS